MTIEDFRKLVTECAEYGYRFSDTEYGFSKISENDIVEQSYGIAVARFRLDVKDIHSVRHFVEYVSSRIKDEPRLMISHRTEFGLPYLECVWVSVINHNEIDDSQEEGIEERVADRFDQDFDSSQYDGDMFA